MTFVTFSVPGKPVAKGRARVSVRGGHPRLYTPEKTQRYEDAVRIAAAVAMGDRMPLDEPVALSVTAYVQIPASLSKRKRLEAIEGRVVPGTRPDADNYAKAALDGCNAILFRDDALVTDLIVRKRYAENPRLVVTMETIRDDDIDVRGVL